MSAAELEFIQGSLGPFIAALLIFIISIYLGQYSSRLIHRTLERQHLTPELASLLARTLYWTILAAGATSALSQLGFDLTSFIASLGIVGIALAFAVQDIAQNFTAGLLLLLQQPFKIGDLVEINGKIGRVTAIEIRATTIRTLDGLLIIMPNAQLLSNPITNFSASLKRQITIIVSLPASVEVETARQLMLEAAQQLASFQVDPPPAALFHEFSSTQVKGKLTFWISNTGQVEHLKAIDLALSSLKTTFNQANIDCSATAQ